MEKRLSKKSNPYEIIKKFVDNMNSLPSANIKKLQMRSKKVHWTLKQTGKDLIFSGWKKLKKKQLDKKNLTRKFMREKNWR